MKKFSDLSRTVKADPVRRARVDSYKAELLRQLSLFELRRARQLTQEQLAAALDTTQSGVSRIEHQTDVYLSTLRSYIEAMGGRLEIAAVFPDDRVSISMFEEIGSPDESARAHDRKRTQTG